MVLDDSNLCRCTANIKIQKAGAKVFFFIPTLFPASDLGVRQTQGVSGPIRRPGDWRVRQPCYAEPKRMTNNDFQA
jgi:hypothetical protein